MNIEKSVFITMESLGEDAIIGVTQRKFKVSDFAHERLPSMRFHSCNSSTRSISPPHKSKYEESLEVESQRSAHSQRDAVLSSAGPSVIRQLL